MGKRLHADYHHFSISNCKMRDPGNEVELKVAILRIFSTICLVLLVLSGWSPDVFDNRIHSKWWRQNGRYLDITT